MESGCHPTPLLLSRHLVARHHLLGHLGSPIACLGLCEGAQWTLGGLYLWAERSEQPCGLSLGCPHLSWGQMRLRRVRGWSRGGWGGVLCTALGKWGCAHSPTLRMRSFPLRSSCPVFLLRALRTVLGTEPCLNLWTFLPESLKPPSASPYPVPSPYLFALLQPQWSAIPQAHQARPCLRALALAAPTARASSPHYFSFPCF